MNSSLKQLQALGIDVWVSHQAASEFIEQGVATPLHQTRGKRPARARFNPSRINQYQRLTPPTPKQPSVRSEKTQNQNTASTTVQPEKSKEEPQAKPYTIKLYVFKRGSAGFLVSKTNSFDARLIEDILIAFAPNEDAHINRLEWEYPPGGVGKQPAWQLESLKLDSAQTGLTGWLNDQFRDRSGYLCILGEDVKEICSVLPDSYVRIELSGLPTDAESKKALWNKIQQNVN